jgi:hypothetical protein
MLTEPVTGELAEQLRMRPERKGDHVILCSTFEFQVVRTSNLSKLEGPLFLTEI